MGIATAAPADIALDAPFLSPTADRETVMRLLASAPGDGKAEIVEGTLLLMSPTGLRPGKASSVIYFSLFSYERLTGNGIAVPDNVGFVIDLPRRRSFSPDAAYCFLPDSGMRYVEGAPAFAVEVRSENDYGPQAETEMAEKRRDYFAAGTEVVWDVDLLGGDVIRKYAPISPTAPVAIFRRGETADAEPAVPDWRFVVDELFGGDAVAAE